MYTFIDRIKNENMEITGSKLFVIDSRLIYAVGSFEDNSLQNDNPFAFRLLAVLFRTWSY